VPKRSESRDAQRMREEAADWALRAGALRAAEKAAFEAWLARDPAHAELYAKAERALAESRSLLIAEPGLAAPPRRRRGGAILVGLFAAAMIGAAILSDLPMRLAADAIAGRGELPRIVLPDGSVLHLNAASAAAFDFSARKRVVRLLRGEGYFEVAPDRERPFEVEAAGGRATAMGTAFDVRLTASGAEVAVAESEVAVDAAGGRATRVRLVAGQRVGYSQDGRIGAPATVDPGNVGAWRQRKLVFDDATVAEVANEIGRHLNGRIVIVGGGLAQRRISGVFDISDPLPALDVLERSLGIRSIRVGGLVILLRS
jgi:transmembrane sensor